MLFVEDLKPLKIYSKPLYLPTAESDKKKGSAIFLLTPNYESSKNLLNSNLLINKLRFSSYYIEKDLTYFISSKVMNKVEDVTETYVHNYGEDDFYHSLYEMSTAERNKLKDSDFGLPKKRKYPLMDRSHVKSAIKFFNYVDEEDEAELARNLNKAIKKFFTKEELPKVGPNNRFSKYYKQAVTEAASMNYPGYHVSPRYKDTMILKPSVPDNFMTKNGYEEAKTPRVCFSSSIDGCLRGLSQNLTDKDLYVYAPISNIKFYKPSIKEVPDSKITGELWSKSDTEVKCIGKIHVNSDNGEDGIKYTYGDKEAELYDWDWNWVEKYDSITEATSLSKLNNLTVKEEKKKALTEYHFYDKDNHHIGNVGCAYGDWNNKTWVVNLDVNKKYRRQGYGSALLDYAVKNLHCTYLRVEKSNTPAFNMYKKYGFKIETEDDKYYFMDLHKDKSITEAYIKDDKDIYYNKDKFDKGEINLCFITGHMGSGKSTMGDSMQSDKVEVYQLDDVVCNDGFSYDNLKEYGDLIYSFFTGVGKKYKLDTRNTEEIEKKFAHENYEESIIKAFVKYAMQYANSHNNTKFVLEGIWLFGYIKPEELKDYAVYIKGTSALKSQFRATKRDLKNAKSNGFSKLQVLKYKAQDVTDVFGYHEKAIKKYRDYFSKLESVSEASLVSTVDKDYKPKGNKNLSSYTKIKIDKNNIKQYKSPMTKHIDPDDDAYLWLDGDTIVAIVAVDHTKNPDWITAIEVNKYYQGYGLGHQVLDFAVKNLNGGALTVAKTNQKAIKMYQRYGFVESTDSLSKAKGGVYKMYLGSAIGVEESTIEYYKHRGSVNEEYEIQSERGFYHYDGTYNCIVTVSGVDKPLRGRGEMLVLDKTNTKVYLVYDEEGKKYKVPGGGFEPDESHLEGTIREVKEEARLEVTACYDTGVKYVEMFEDDPDISQAKFDPKDRFYGFYTEVFIGTAIDTYDGDLDTVDVDDKMTKGKFYPIEKVFDDLKDAHKQALSVIVRENYLNEEANISNLRWYHFEPARPGFNPKGAGGWDEEQYYHSLDEAVKHFELPEGSDSQRVHVYTVGDNVGDSYYLGILNIMRTSNDVIDWEWDETAGLSDGIISYLHDEQPRVNTESTEEVPDESELTESVSALILKDGKLLVENHIKCNALTLPGGKVDEGESQADAIKRELREELGIEAIEFELFKESVFKCEYPAGSGNYKWFKDYCYIVRRYEGEISNCEPMKHSEILYYYIDDLMFDKDCRKSTLLQCIFDYLKDEEIIAVEDTKIKPEDITCSGYKEDIAILKYIATPQMYQDLLDALEINFDVVPKIRLIGGDKEDLEVLRNDEGTNEIFVYMYSQSLDRLSIEQYIKVVQYIMAIGIIEAKYPNLKKTIFPIDISDYIVGNEGETHYKLIDTLIDTYGMRGLFEKINSGNYTDIYKVAKELEIKDIQSVDSFLKESKAITADSLTKSLKYRTSTKHKTAIGKLRNSTNRLIDSIKDSMQIKTPTVSLPSSKSSTNESVLSESVLEDIKEENYIISGDYVTLFEDAAYDPVLRRILYSERIVKRKEVIALLDRVRADVPYIKFAYPELSRYQTRNLFVDLYYYNQAFFKNNEWTLKRGFNLYLDFLDRLINDKRIIRAGYTRRTVFIPINDWCKDPTTRMWLYREDINPISIIYELMINNPQGLQKLLKGVDVVFFDKNRYFVVDFTDTKNIKRTAAKFKLFVTKINKHEEFETDDIDTTQDTPTKKAIKADIVDKIETSKGVDLTQADNEVKAEKKSDTIVSVYNTTVKTPAKKVTATPTRRPATKSTTPSSTTKKDDKVEEEPVVDKSVSKATKNKPINQDTSKSDKEVLKTVVKQIDTAVDNSVDVDDAMDYLDSEEFKELIIGLDSMKDDAVNINAARAERMTELDRELLDKDIKGRSIRDILGDNDTPEGLNKKAELPKSDIPVASPNEEWHNMKYVNFDKSYDIEKDIVNIFKFWSGVTRPLSIRNIKAEDNSTSEDRVDLYSVDYEDYRGKRYSIKVDIPKMKNNRFLLRGNPKMIQTQFFNMPIVKTNLDTCQIVTNYRKIIISRYNTSNGRSLPNTARFIKAVNKYKGNKIKVTVGDNSRVCAKYILPIDYIDLAANYSIIETSDYKFYFNQDQIRKEYEVNDTLGVPYGISKKDNSLIYFSNKSTTPFVDTLFDQIANLGKGNDVFRDLFMSAKGSSRGTFSRARIMSSDIPLVVVCAYSEGLTQVLKKANIQYQLVDKLTSDIRNSITSDYIRFNDGYLVYSVNYNSSLLLNGLKDCDTEGHSITEIDNKNMYLDFLDNYGGRIKADGLDNFYDCEIDPITIETLKYYKLPTDYVSVLLYANYLLSDNKYIKHTDTCSRRARRLEIIAAYLYQVLSESYGAYSTSIKHNHGAAAFTCKQSAVIDKIMADPTSSDYSVINMVNDIECTNAITTKGLTGMNDDRSYSLDKRTYDDSMLGVVGMSTGFSGNVGITRQATLDMNIEGGRGYVKDNKGKTDKLNTATALTATESIVPFATTHDDPMRVAMTFIQTSKHSVRTEESDPLLVTSGSDEALPYICSDQFAYKAKDEGIIKELDDNGMIIEYKDGSKDYVNLKETIEKNSDGGFYVPLKLDAADKLKVGSKVKPNQILAYDKYSMSNSLGESDNLATNVGKLAKIAIINTDDGHEDAGIITHSMAEKLACKIITKVDCVLDKDTNIYNVVEVNSHVEQGDPLIIWQTPYDEEDINALMRVMSNDSDSISEFGRHSLKADVTGRLAGMKLYRTVDKDKLSPSLKALVDKYEQPIGELRQRLKDEGIDYTDLPANYPLTPTGKLKGAADGVLIEFYIEYVDTPGIGDKITYNAANKATIKNVIPKGNEPYTDFRPNEEISAFVSETSISKRLVSSTNIYGSLQKLMVELDRSCKDLAGIKYDDSKV